MATYDDRPISVYDNLNMPTTTTPKKSPTTSSNSNNNSSVTSSPYADISFKFNENNNAARQQQQYQQQRHQTAQQLPSNNQSLNQTYTSPTSTFNSNQNATTMSNNSNNYAAYASIPFKPTIQQTINTPIHPTYTSIQPQHQQPTTTTAAAYNNNNNNSTTKTQVTNASPNVRPLSQHSQTDLNEATVQSLAAVKAALHDAKSKFFGLNGYAAAATTTTPNDNNQQQQSIQAIYESPRKHQQQQPILYDNSTTPQQHRPKVQILTPPPKPTPKYQNIPENSAIFRNQTPPVRPPKPIHFQSSNPHGGVDICDDPSPSSTSSATSSKSSSPNNRLAEADATMSTPNTKQQTSSTSSKSVSPARSLPFNTTYKQIPLNDVDMSSPSQAVYMSTTVPQNIKGTKIAGRHTPTRNSLRHSRMLVINNKNYQVIQHPNPMNFKHPNLARWLLILQILIGALLACLSIWIFLLAPNTAIQDNPYWSGLVLLLAGIFGLILIRYPRIQRHKVRENCFLFLRADSYILSLTAALLCCVAMVFAAIHFARLMASDTICLSSNILQAHATCLCTFNASPEMLEALGQNATLESEHYAWLGSGPDESTKEKMNDIDDHSYRVEYRDLSCQEVKCEWTTILGISLALNGLGLLVTFIYIVLLACHRYNSRRIYTSVQTSTF